MQQNLLLRIKTLQNLIQLLKIDKTYKEALKYGANNYNINPYKINKLRLQDIPDLMNLIDVNYINYDKEQYEITQKRCIWLANQLKLFIWMAICYSYLLNKPIQEMDLENWEFFSATLTRKNIDDLEFQSKSLFKNFHGNKEKWDNNEESLLRQIIQDEKYHNKWNEISKLLYFRSKKKYYRSSQKCRQHWFNHLDPRLNKNPWSYDEDLRLVFELQNYGFKWSKITQVLQIKQGYRRTEHMVKNRTKLLCKKYGFKEDKQQGCQKQLKHIEKRINEQKQKSILEQQFGSTQSKQIQTKKTIEKSIVFSENEQQNILEEEQYHSGDQLKNLNNIGAQTSKIKIQQQEHQSNFQRQQQKVQQLHIQIQKFEQQDQKSESSQKGLKKRSIIILCQTKTQKRKVITIEDDSGTISESQQQQQLQQQSVIIGHNIYENNVQDNQSVNYHDEKDFYDDEYQIIQEVDNQLYLNEDIKFNHELHGGRMRDRVTHQLEQFFDNGSKQQEISRN